MKKVAVLQSNYIPWKGYFDIIHDVDLFIFHDDLQYTKNDWRNRNKIMTVDGLKWLTIPVGTDEHRLICEVKIPNRECLKKHYQILKMAYGKCPYFGLYDDFLRFVYLEKEWIYLYELNRYMIQTIAKDFLGIHTEFADSREFSCSGVKHEKLLTMLKSAKAEMYVSGPAAKDYILEEEYKKNGIELVWKDYSGYPVYPTIYPNFVHEVSILDLLFHTGKEAREYIWDWRQK